MAETDSARPRLLVLATVVAAPMAFAFETVLRMLIAPEEFEGVRAFLRGPLTPVAWALAGVALLATVGGLFVYDRVAARAIAKLPADRRTDEHRVRAATGAFLLTSAVPQIPAVLCTVMFTFGAPFLPVAVGIGIASLGVVAQAIRVTTR